VINYQTVQLHTAICQ